MASPRQVGGMQRGRKPRFTDEDLLALLGDWTLLADLVWRLGVSSSTVSERLGLLKAEGLVERRLHKGSVGKHGKSHMAEWRRAGTDQSKKV